MKFSQALASQIAEGSVQLVALGGNEVPITTKVDGHSLLVTPSKPLNSGQEYMLLVHPSIQKETGNKLQKAFIFILQLKIKIKNKARTNVFWPTKIPNYPMKLS